MDILIFTVIIAFYLYGVCFASLCIQHTYSLNKDTIKFISNKNKFKLTMFILGSWLSLIYSFYTRN